MFKSYVISKDFSCLQALQKLGTDGIKQTLFVLDNNGKLKGTITDGDIRRGLINGLQLDDTLEYFMNKKFAFINHEKFNVNEVKRLRERGIRALPRVSAEGEVQKVYDLTKFVNILPVHAIIMAGGKGERLRPLTEKTPKPLLPLGKKPIIEHNIDKLISYGIENISISVKYLGDQIKNYFGDGSSKGITINYIEEDKPLGTIGCLSEIKSFSSEYLLVMNSDLFTNINLESFFLEFIKKDVDMSVASIPYSVNVPYAIMNLEEDKVLSFEEKPKNTYYANAGIYLMKRETASLIPKDSFFNATDLMDAVIEKGTLIHYPITGYWIDIGKHDDYNRAKEVVKHLETI